MAQQAAGLYRDLVEVSPAAYTPDLARSLNNLAIGLSEVGRSDDALEVAQQAAGLYRDLVEVSPAAYTPDLAASLNNLANFLSEVGRSVEALEVAQQAAGLYRDLVEVSPAAYTPDLARSLNNLTKLLSQGRCQGEPMDVYIQDPGRLPTSVRECLLLTESECYSYSKLADVIQGRTARNRGCSQEKDNLSQVFHRWVKDEK